MNGSSDNLSSTSSQLPAGKGSNVGIPTGRATINLTGSSATTVISSSTQPPAKIHHGFSPSYPGPFDTTKSGDLPGSRNESVDEVITTPPFSQTSSTQLGSRGRTRSIEESDKSRENYAPGEKNLGGPGGVQESSSFCLGLSSYILTQHNTKESSGKMAPGHKRQYSTSSEASTISVSCEDNLSVCWEGCGLGGVK